MEKEAVSEKDVAVESETNVEVVNPDNNQNEIGKQKEQADSARKQQTDLDGMCNILFKYWFKKEYKDNISHFAFINGSGGDGGVSVVLKLQRKNMI